jgi:hypothetical protein
MREDESILRSLSAMGTADVCAWMDAIGLDA